MNDNDKQWIKQWICLLRCPLPDAAHTAPRPRRRPPPTPSKLRKAGLHRARRRASPVLTVRGAFAARRSARFLHLPGTMRFRDRHPAGQELAKKLDAYRDRRDVIVLGLPRGGIPVAYEVAQYLHAPL